MPDAPQSRSYRISLLLAAMAVRALVGIARPDLSLTATIIVGVTTVLLLAPILHRQHFGRELLTSGKQVATYTVLTGLALGGFGYWIVAG